MLACCVSCLVKVLAWDRHLCLTGESVLTGQRHSIVGYFVTFDIVEILLLNATCVMWKCGLNMLIETSVFLGSLGHCRYVQMVVVRGWNNSQWEEACFAPEVFDMCAQWFQMVWLRISNRALARSFQIQSVKPWSALYGCILHFEKVINLKKSLISDF